MKTQEHFKQLDNIRKKDGLLEAGLYDFKKTLKRHPHAKTAALAGLVALVTSCGGGGGTEDPTNVTVYRWDMDAKQCQEQTIPEREYLESESIDANYYSLSSEECLNIHDPFTTFYRVDTNAWSYSPTTDTRLYDQTALDFLTDTEAQAYINANKPGPGPIDPPVDPFITVWGCDGDDPISWQIRQSVYDTNPSAYNLNPVPCGSG